MKRPGILLLLSLFAVLTVSCSKSGPKPPTTPTTPPIVPDNISFAFNGNQKSSLLPQAIYSRISGMLSISSRINSGENIALTINNAAVGSFTIEKGEASASYALSSNASDLYTAVTGTVNISAFTDNVVSGSFQFSGTTPGHATGLITSGQFVVNEITQ